MGQSKSSPKSRQSQGKKKAVRLDKPYPKKRKCKGKPAGEGGKCGSKLCNRKGTCKNPAGLRTDHSGSGRCYRHGGCSPVKHGLYSTVMRKSKSKKFMELYEKQLQDQSLLRSIDEEIAMLRVCVCEMINDDQEFIFGPTRVERIAALLEATTRAVKRKHDIEQAHAMRLTPNELRRFVDTMENVITKYVGDPKVMAALGRDLHLAYFGREYSQPLPAIGQGGAA